MCDTFGVIGSNKIFGKNSDRSPNEIQIIEFIPRHKNENKKLKTTYIEIDEVEEVNSILISRPTWMWGAEMGVNEHGLVIGNEAIFTKGKYATTGLTGMDLLRLALERCKDAKEACTLIKQLIREYGMGGNCGYDHKFLYDNSFLIMDRKNIIVLECSNNKFSVKDTKMANISNCLSIKNKEIKEDKIYKYFSKSKKRSCTVNDSLNKGIDVMDAFKLLRSHDTNKPFKGSVSSVCMHAGKLIGDHTTNSLVVELLPNKINVYSTFGSLPCISVYKKWVFGSKVEYPIIENNKDIDYYKNNELIKREISLRNIQKSFYEDRDLLEINIINDKINLKESLIKEKELYNEIVKENPIRKYSKYWIKKNKNF